MWTFSSFLLSCISPFWDKRAPSHVSWAWASGVFHGRAQGGWMFSTIFGVGWLEYEHIPSIYMHRLFSYVSGCVEIASPLFGWSGWGLWDRLRALAGNPLSGQGLHALLHAWVLTDCMVCIGWGRTLILSLLHPCKFTPLLFAGPPQDSAHKKKTVKICVRWESNRSWFCIF